VGLGALDLSVAALRDHSQLSRYHGGVNDSRGGGGGAAMAMSLAPSLARLVVGGGGEASGAENARVFRCRRRYSEKPTASCRQAE